jgi:Uma2 family endonuclease
MLDVEMSSRVFEPGTTGWTARDLDDPAIESAWARGRYEIVEGVLSKMPPAYFVGGNSTFNLMMLLKAYSNERGLSFRLAAEGEIVIDDVRVLRADAVLLTPTDSQRQDQAAQVSGKPDLNRVRLLVAPTLVIESISPGHELHDRRIKRAWYAEFGIANYWMIDAFGRTLECLRLERDQYVVDVQGEGDQTLTPSAFPGLVIPLRQLWEA